jgi:Domain of unknown function (DUF4916)
VTRGIASEDALEVMWFSRTEPRDPAVLAGLLKGRATLLLQALAHLSSAPEYLYIG